MIRFRRISLLFFLTLAFASGWLIAQPPAVEKSDAGWQTAPTKQALLESLQQRDAAFGDYVIEFDLTRSRKRNPLAEWWSINWKRRPPERPKPPDDLEPPHLETKVQRYLFATHGNEEHMDWHITEVRKDGKKDEDHENVGKGARYSTWGETVRSEYYKVGEEVKPPKDAIPGDPRFPQVHKGKSSVPPTILDGDRMRYELCAGIGMSKRIKQIDAMEVRDGLLNVTGKMSHVWSRESDFEMELTSSLLPRRILISIPQVVEEDGSKYDSKFLVETKGELQHKFAPVTPNSAKFEHTTTVESVEGKTSVRTNTQFDDMTFTNARGQVGLDEFIKMARLEPTSDF